MIQNKKMSVYSEGGLVPRVWRRKGTKVMCPRILIKCGCCHNSVEIYHNVGMMPTGEDQIEINGVLASKEHWREIFREAEIIE